MFPCSRPQIENVINEDFYFYMHTLFPDIVCCIFETYSYIQFRDSDEAYVSRYFIPSDHTGDEKFWPMGQMYYLALLNGLIV